MKHGLIEAWGEQEFRRPPYKFSGDEDRFLTGKTISIRNDELIRHENYADLDPRMLHLALIPVPFVGNLERADIFIALINPGLCLGLDHYVETIPEFRDLLRRNLKQELGSEAYPFFKLDPRWHWTSAGTWWHRLFGGIIRAIAKNNGSSYVEATKLVSKRIAALELVPYHSGNSTHISGLARKLESSRLMKAYANEVIIPRAKSGEALFVVASGRSMWGVTSRHPNVVYPPENSRRALFDVGNGAGQKILRRLLDIKH
jgi:hypothetical protein